MRRNLLLLGAAVVVLALTVGTGGFSAAELERGLSVSVSDSDSALVSLYDPGDTNPPDWAPETATEEPTVTDADDRVPVVYVHNRFEEQTLRIDLEPESSDVLTDTTPVTVGAGRTEAVPATVDCVGGDREVTLTVVAEGDGMSARIDFPVTVDCRAPATTTPTDS
jgi:hypothetical protein